MIQVMNSFEINDHFVNAVHCWCESIHTNNLLVLAGLFQKVETLLRTYCIKHEAAKIREIV